MTTLNLKISDFDGPLDLLLTLVKENKMSVDNINLLVIAEQYLKFIYAQQDLEINIASEYLLMASNLLFIKSKLVLNSTMALSDEEMQQLDQERQKLINQIILYKRYRDLVPKFNAFLDNRSKMLSKGADDIEQVLNQKVDKQVYILPNQINFNALYKAMQAAYEKWRLNIFNNHKIIIQEVSAEQVEKDILHIFKAYPNVKKYSMSDFFQLIDENILSDQYLVTCFVCLLDLAKNGHIVLEQNELDDEIYFEIRS